MVAGDDATGASSASTGTDPPSDEPPTASARGPEPGVGPVEVPLLIFAPGFVRSGANSGTRVAELVAHHASLLLGTYSAVESKEHAVAGLRVCRTVVGPHGTPVLEVAELDYLGRLEDEDLVGARQTAPGFLRSGLLAVRGLAMLVPATFRAGKSGRAKLQLFLGFGAVALLLALAVVAAVAALSAAGVGKQRIADVTATRVAVFGGASVAAIWAALRPQLVAAAGRIERVMDFADKHRYRATVVSTLYEVLDGLRDRGRAGAVHLVGFSFGTLVLLDALFPQEDREPDVGGTGNLEALASRVTSLTTIGSPADFARLYWPDWFENRRALAPSLYWLNILNDSDVFGSNFRDDRDGSDEQRRPRRVRWWWVDALAWVWARAESQASRDEREKQRAAPPSPMTPTRSISYQPPKALWKLLVMGDFTAHGDYWGGPKADSCFKRESLLRLWFDGDIPHAAPTRSGVAQPAS